jgi:hypothetical protein
MTWDKVRKGGNNKLGENIKVFLTTYLATMCIYYVKGATNYGHITSCGYASINIVFKENVHVIFTNMGCYKKNTMLHLPIGEVIRECIMLHLPSCPKTCDQTT